MQKLDEPFRQVRHNQRALVTAAAGVLISILFVAPEATAIPLLHFTETSSTTLTLTDSWVGNYQPDSPPTCALDSGTPDKWICKDYSKPNSLSPASFYIYEPNDPTHVNEIVFLGIDQNTDGWSIFEVYSDVPTPANATIYDDNALISLEAQYPYESPGPINIQFTDLADSTESSIPAPPPFALIGVGLGGIGCIKRRAPKRA
jgi:hypothetical protein